MLHTLLFDCRVRDDSCDFHEPQWILQTEAAFVSVYILAILLKLFARGKRGLGISLGSGSASTGSTKRKVEKKHPLFSLTKEYKEYRGYRIIYHFYLSIIFMTDLFNCFMLISQTWPFVNLCIVFLMAVEVGFKMWFNIEGTFLHVHREE